jgi:hypothetical protein
MPRYTAQYPVRAVHPFLLDQGHEEKRIEAWTFEEWVQEGPNRFVFREEGEDASEIACAVESDDDYHASVFLSDVGSHDVCIREIE